MQTNLFIYLVKIIKGPLATDMMTTMKKINITIISYPISNKKLIDKNKRTIIKGIIEILCFALF